jgi:hypothetical protein
VGDWSLVCKVAPVLKYHGMEAHRWCGCESLHILGHSISWRPMVGPTLQLLCPRECHNFALDRKSDGCRVSWDRVVMKKMSSCVGNVTVIFKHVVSYITSFLSLFIDDVSTAWFMLYQIKG